MAHDKDIDRDKDRDTNGPDELRITRVTNACVLIELGPFAVLTDPWFSNPWGFNEEPGLAVEDLPRLDAIIGSHFVPDHWDMGALASYEHRDATQVYTATRAMAKSATKAGFRNVECLPWGETREIAPGLILEVIEAQSFFSIPSNNYVLSAGGTRVFFGGETRRLAPLRAYRTSQPPVDVVLAPVNGMRLLGFRLVATAEEALEATRVLGGHTLVPIHDSMHAMGFGGPTSGSHDLRDRADTDPRVLILEAGARTPIT